MKLTSKQLNFCLKELTSGQVFSEGKDSGDFGPPVEDLLDLVSDDQEVLELLMNSFVKIQNEFNSLCKNIRDLNESRGTVTNEDEKNEELSEDMAHLDDLMLVANKLDESDDPELHKCASVLDQLLLNFAHVSRSALKQAELSQIEKLKQKYREEEVDKLYKNPKENLHNQIKASEIAKEINDSVKQFRPLEHALSTRTCPEHPGAQLQRVGEYNYQCDLDKKVYDFRSGYTTMKGNKIPGGDVALQSQSLNDGAPNQMSLSTRENILNP